LYRMATTPVTPQHVQLVQGLRLGGQRLDQPAGDRAERHVVGLPGPADDQQDADRAGLGAHRLRRFRRFVMGPHESRGPQGQDRVGMGVAEQFPGDGLGVAHAGGSNRSRYGARKVVVLNVEAPQPAHAGEDAETRETVTRVAGLLPLLVRRPNSDAA
jgi:hypothetical protein